jgi:hypothetical protein
MGWFTRKADPISDRARVLNAEITALEEAIQRLDAQLQNELAHPRLRSTALPHGPTLTRTSQPQPPPSQAVSHEPIFENSGHDVLKSRAETPMTPEHYNEFGFRKYDLTALFRRLRQHFRGPTTANPKLVNYLAAGSIQGLRPLRYEKRVERNRCIALAAFLFLVLLGIIAALVRR